MRILCTGRGLPGAKLYPLNHCPSLPPVTSADKGAEQNSNHDFSKNNAYFGLFLMVSKYAAGIGFSNH